MKNEHGGYWPKTFRKNCPKCKKINCKYNIINHIQCWNCGVHFCFECNAVGKGLKTKEELLKHLKEAGHEYGK